VPLPSDDFIRRNTQVLTLRDGTRVLVRPVVPSDKDALQAGMERLSPESRYRRFMMSMEKLTPAMLRYLTEIDYDHHFALVAFAVEEPGEPAIAVARYIRVADEPDVAEAAIAVVDDHQRKGLATLLVDLLEAKAVEHGVRWFRAWVLAENHAMREGLRSAGARLVFDSAGVYRTDVELPSESQAKAKAMYDILRAAGQGGFRRVRSRIAVGAQSR